MPALSVISVKRMAGTGTLPGTRGGSLALLTTAGLARSNQICHAQNPLRQRPHTARTAITRPRALDGGERWALLLRIKTYTPVQETETRDKLLAASVMLMIGCPL